MKMTPNQKYNIAFCGHIELGVWLKQRYPNVKYEDLWLWMLEFKKDEDSKKVKI